MYNGDDWKSICRMVSDVCFPIFPHLRKKSVRSAIMSNVFESQAERYYKSKNMNVRASTNDRDPDLLFVDDNVPCEIKVTGADDCVFDSRVTWLGGSYSKRNCDYIFVVWNYRSVQSLYGQNDILSYVVFKSIINEDDWKELSRSKDYYGLGLKSDLFETRSYDQLVGTFLNKKFKLEEFNRIDDGM